MTNKILQLAFILFLAACATKQSDMERYTQVPLPCNQWNAGEGCSQEIVLNNSQNSNEMYQDRLIELEKVADYMRANPKQQVELGGHTYNTRNKTKDFKWGEQIARFAKDYLIYSGVHSKNIKTTSFGHDKIQVVPDTEPSNLRLSVKFLCSEKVHCGDVKKGSPALKE